MLAALKHETREKKEIIFVFFLLSLGYLVCVVLLFVVAIKYNILLFFWLVAKRESYNSLIKYFCLVENKSRKKRGKRPCDMCFVFMWNTLSKAICFLFVFFPKFLFFFCRRCNAIITNNDLIKNRVITVCSRRMTFGYIFYFNPFTSRNSELNQKNSICCCNILNKNTVSFSNSALDKVSCFILIQSISVLAGF